MLFEMLLAIGVAAALLVVDHIFQFSNKAIVKSIKQASDTREQKRIGKPSKRGIDNERV